MDDLNAMKQQIEDLRSYAKYTTGDKDTSFTQYCDGWQNALTAMDDWIAHRINAYIRNRVGE